jgi:hypothetical protein
VVCKALQDRRISDKILNHGAEAVAERREIGITFAQFCFHRHLNHFTQTSADEFRAVKPFGVYPFLYRASPAVARYLFSFVLCNWRWLDCGKCRHYPRQCNRCICENTAWHLLFECPKFSCERAVFQQNTGFIFDYPVLLMNESFVAKQTALTGKTIYEHLCTLV